VNSHAIKELFIGFIELQAGTAKHLVIEQLDAEPKQTKVDFAIK
jgi:hypothetical protein